MGKNILKTFSAKFTGANLVSLTYKYINSSGDESASISKTLTTSGTWYTLDANIISINEWSLSVPIESTNTLHISYNGADTGTLYGGNVDFQNSGLFTCPNNAVAWISYTSIAAASATNIYVYKFDTSGIRKGIHTFYGVSPNQSTVSYSDFCGCGGLINAGETVAVTSGGTSSVNTYFYSKIVVHYF